MNMIRFGQIQGREKNLLKTRERAVKKNYLMSLHDLHYTALSRVLSGFDAGVAKGDIQAQVGYAKAKFSESLHNKIH